MLLRLALLSRKQFLQEAIPGPEVQSGAEILAYIKESLATIHHAAATCKMGRPGDPEAVVDSRGRVLGVQQLRIVDASAFNLLPPGHSQSTVYMLAEKMADLIKTDFENADQSRTI